MDKMQLIRRIGGWSCIFNSKDIQEVGIYFFDLVRVVEK
jgi:hypothetical protein